MSTIQAANLVFESTANNRITYNANTLTVAVGGVNAIAMNVTTLSTARALAAGNTTITGYANVSGTLSVNNTPISPFDGGYKNKIINGNFNLWSRGTSSTVNQGEPADKWISQNSGTTKTVSRQSFTLGQTDVPGEPTYFIRHVVTSSAGASNNCELTTRIFDVRTLAGKTVTVSFWAKADASKNIATEFVQLFGLGGTPSAANTAIGVTTHALTTSWQKFTATVSIPSISGKTLGSNDPGSLEFSFWFDAGSTWNSRTNSLGQQSGTFDIAQVQLEEGPVATAFEDRTINQELILSNPVTSFMGPYKNKIINGNFDIWQRGTSNTSSGYYTADRWSSIHSGSSKTASRQSFTLGQTDVPGEPTYFMRHVVTSSAGAGNFVTLYQSIESARTMAGKTVTVSFWAKADASKNIATEFYQSFGTGGSPSSAVSSIGVTTHALTTSWQKFTATVLIPSISGKTLGSNNNDHLAMNFWFDAGSTNNSRTNSLGQQSGTFDIAQVQVEEGPVATAFEQRHIGQELALCQRYYQKYNASNFFRTYNQSTVGADIIVYGFWPQQLRGTPTLSANGDIQDGAFFTAWTATFTDAWYWTLTKGTVPAGQFLDLNELIGDAEL